jgi:hypothetical protein
VSRASGARRSPQAYRPARSGRTVSPGAVLLAIALGGSVVFALYTLTVREASQIPLLASGSAVLGIAFIAVAVYAARSAWRAGLDRRSGRAMALALSGGISAMIGAGGLAGAIILFMLSRPSA